MFGIEDAPEPVSHPARPGLWGLDDQEDAWSVEWLPVSEPGD